MLGVGHESRADGCLQKSASNITRAVSTCCGCSALGGIAIVSSVGSNLSPVVQWVGIVGALWMMSVALMLCLAVRRGDDHQTENGWSSQHEDNLHNMVPMVWARVTVAEAIRWQKKESQMDLEFETHEVQVLWNRKHVSNFSSPDFPPLSIGPMLIESLSDDTRQFADGIDMASAPEEHPTVALDDVSVSTIHTQVPDENAPTRIMTSSIGVQTGPCHSPQTPCLSPGPRGPVGRSVSPTLVPCSPSSAAVDVPLSEDSIDLESQDGLAKQHPECRNEDCGHSTHVSSTKSVDSYAHSTTTSKSRVSRACPCCLGDFVKVDTVALLRCGHIFCEECLISWLRNSGTCPVCRRSPLLAK